MNEDLKNKLDTLINELCENEEKDNTLLELDQLLKNNKEAQKYYLTQIDLHHSLLWEVESTLTHEAFLANKPAPKRAPVMWGRYATAAALLLALLLIFYNRGDDTIEVATSDPEYSFVDQGVVQVTMQSDVDVWVHRRRFAGFRAKPQW